MDERRKNKRKYLLYYGRVYDERAQSLLGHLVDITQQGLMLLSDQPFPVGVTQQIKLEVTDDLAEQPYLSLTVKSIWCEPDVDPNHFNTGFEILALKPDDEQVIKMIIENYGFRDN
ncbi:MAG: PilZ domain-containing protein [Chloroflexi bacterium]|nr:PilZ domain-containing protein [Chloroflexota bacterium]